MRPQRCALLRLGLGQIPVGSAEYGLVKLSGQIKAGGPVLLTGGIYEAGYG